MWPKGTLRWSEGSAKKSNVEGKQKLAGTGDGGPPTQSMDAGGETHSQLLLPTKSFLHKTDSVSLCLHKILLQGAAENRHSINGVDPEEEMPFPLICVPETTLQNGLLSAGVQTSRKSTNQGDRFRNIFCSRAAGPWGHSSALFYGTGKQGLSGVTRHPGSPEVSSEMVPMTQQSSRRSRSPERAEREDLTQQGQQVGKKLLRKSKA